MLVEQFSLKLSFQTVTTGKNQMNRLNVNQLHKFLSMAAVIGGALLLFGQERASATTNETWSGANSTWATSGNWSGNAIPSSNLYTATFSGTSADASVSIATTPETVNSLTFSSSAQAYTITGGSTADPLTVDVNNAGSAGNALTAITNSSANAQTIGVSNGNTLLVLTNSGTNSANVVLDNASTGSINIDGSTSIAAAIEVGSNVGTITFENDNSSGSIAITKGISGGANTGAATSAAVVIDGGKVIFGTTTYSTVNSFTGGLTIQAGTLQVNGIGAPSANTSVGNGTSITLGSNGYTGTLEDVTTFTDTTAYNFVLAAGGGGAFERDSSGTFTLSGTISGSGSLTFDSPANTGGGNYTVSGTNTYTGSTTIDANATEIITADANLGTAPSSATVGSLVLNGGTLKTTTLTLASTRGVALGSSSGSGNGTFDVSSGKTLTYGGIIADVAGGTGDALIKTDTGTLSLGGVNTYSGGTTVNAGTLTVTSGGTLGASTGPLAVNNPNTGAGTAVILNLNSGSPTTTGSLSGTIATPSSLTNTATINNGGQLFTVNQTTAGTYAGVIAGTGGFALGSSSTTTLALSGANTYSGGTTVSGGNLQLISSAVGTTSSATGTSTVAVSGGTSTVVSGTGQALGVVTVTNGSHLAPGVNTSGNFGSVGTLGLGTGTSSGLTLTNANLDFDLGTSAVGTSDVITTSALSLGTLTFNLSGTTLQTGTPYDLINDTSESGFNASNITTAFMGPLTGAYTAQYAIAGGTNGTDLEVTFTSAPEPSTVALTLGGLGFLFLWARRRRQAV